VDRVESRLEKRDKQLFLHQGGVRVKQLRVHYLILTEETRPDPSWLSADSVQRPD
jgi:hypothetical protein